MTTELRSRSFAGYAWGYNNAGGLGIGNVARATAPVPVEFPRDTVNLQGGTDFTVALTSTGQVWTWGGNGYGQLGDGSNRLRLTPYHVQPDVFNHVAPTSGVPWGQVLGTRRGMKSVGLSTPRWSG
ncbi:MAG TPA: hypothetical protein VH063_11825 [Gaiellaceae bacterium]|jgi:alpha-tubulin suppressor-like RCC1 family protein|nr:hypothetical protein [Gaiellaceae bacterium]